MSAYTALQTTITNTSAQQDLELAQALAALNTATDGAGSSVLNNFLTERRAELYDTIRDEHSDTAAKVYNDLLRADNSVNSVMYYYSRNKDLKNVQGGILSRAEQEAQAAVHDNQLLKRQFEINEWSAANKSETVFILQLMLIGLTASIFMLFLNRIGVLPTSVFVAVTALIFIAFIFTVVIRAQYTNNVRDGRYWNRRRFPTLPQPNEGGACPTPEGVSGYFDEAGDYISSTGERVVGAYQAFTQGLGSAVSSAAAVFDASGNRV
jgi:hypothetical protein